MQLDIHPNDKLYCPVLSGDKIEIKTGVIVEITHEGHILASIPQPSGSMMRKRMMPVRGEDYFTIGTKPGLWQPWFLSRAKAMAHGRKMLKSMHNSGE